MSSPRSAIAALILLMGGPALGSGQTPRNPYEHDSIVGGRVARVHAPRLFTMTTDVRKGEELLVFVPNAEATPLVGTTVAARGIFRWLEDAGIESSDDWRQVDEETREELSSQPVLVAISVVTSTRRELAAVRSSAEPARPIQRTPRASQPPQTEHRGSAPPMPVRPDIVADYVNTLGGRFVRMTNARVVGLFDSRVFLVDPQTSMPPVVDRSRVLVFIDAATLRVDAEMLVGSTVTVSGVVRTLLGIKVTREVPWPAAVTRETVEHLDIRAAFLAHSVQTADGVELTTPLSPARAEPATTTPALRRAAQKER